MELLTWDTLKRRRRQKREALLSEENQDGGNNSLWRLKEGSCFKSTPNLLSSNSEFRESRSSVLKYAVGPGRSSLITFDFLEQKLPESEIEILRQTADGEHGESEHEEAVYDANDSGHYCDSDSGISSIYDTIQHNEFQPSRDSNSKVSGDFDEDVELVLKILNVKDWEVL